mmetsp:Transcript_12554/g.12969  ORF Transcript_12554/g.12969 Transcript_12554/m.12969 type:complete len:289 (+) Transcript_12554:43-909(+)
MFYLFILLVNFIVKITSFNCELYTSPLGANYDITGLIRASTDPSYTVTDGDLPCTTNVIEQNFTYYFNICGAVTGKLPTACTSIAETNKVSALQIDKRVLDDPNDDFCFLVGVYAEQSTRVDLINPTDPSKGISLTYYGDYCHHPASQRKFKIELECADRLNPVPTSALEYEHCSYTVTMPSVYGCPLECPVANRELCGGNGHCAYDIDKGAARCFCNHGFKGAACTESDKEEESLNYSPALLGLIAALFVVIVLLVGGIFFMIKQLSAYKEDLVNYHSLRGDENESI